MKIEEIISAIQSKLGVEVDGRPGPETWGAIYERIVGPKTKETSVASEIALVDAQSEQKISTLLPKIQPMARALVQKAALGGIKIKIISGLRTYAQQDALYAQGRTASGKIVTKAKGGCSNHNFGIAFDIGVFEGSTYLGDSPKYNAVGVIGMDLGLEWGGSWKNMVDQPHFQLRPAWAKDMTETKMLIELRSRVADGRTAYA